MSKLKLAILGAGQLGKMLLETKEREQFEIWMLDRAGSPASSLCDHFIEGSPMDGPSVKKVSAEADLVTIEIEAVNVQALKEIAGQAYPQPEVIATIQDRLRQKTFLKEHRFSTADFFVSLEEEELPDHLPLVQKLRRGGYDGRGTKILHSREDLQDRLLGECIYERAVSIERELAVIAARSPAGQIKTYPTVEMIFNPELNQLDLLACPAQIEAALDHEAQRIAAEIADSLEIVGLLAVELFLDSHGNLIVNELAPRPHNSGHHTIEACQTSQYEQLLLALQNKPLGDTSLNSPAVMVNLVGADGHFGEPDYSEVLALKTQEGVFVHLYGKAETRPGRKMGHITILNNRLENAIEEGRRMKQWAKIKSKSVS